MGVTQLNMEERQKAIEALQKAHSAPLYPQQSSFVLWFWLLQLGPAGYCLGWAPVPTSRLYLLQLPAFRPLLYLEAVLACIIHRKTEVRWKDSFRGY